MANTYPNNKTPIFTDVNDVPVEATQTNPSNGSDFIAKLNQTLDWLDSDFTAVENDIGTLQTDVSANTTNISANTNDISSLQTDVSNLDTRVTANESDISTLQTDVSNNTTAISNNDSDISTLQTDVSNLQTRVTNLENKVNNKLNADFEDYFLLVRQQPSTSTNPDDWELNLLALNKEYFTEDFTYAQLIDFYQIIPTDKVDEFYLTFKEDGDGNNYLRYKLSNPTDFSQKGNLSDFGFTISTTGFFSMTKLRNHLYLFESSGNDIERVDLNTNTSDYTDTILGGTTQIEKYIPTKITNREVPDKKFLVLATQAGSNEDKTALVAYDETDAGLTEFERTEVSNSGGLALDVDVASETCWLGVDSRFKHIDYTTSPFTFIVNSQATNPDTSEVIIAQGLKIHEGYIYVFCSNTIGIYKLDFNLNVIWYSLLNTGSINVSKLEIVGNSLFFQINNGTLEQFFNFRLSDGERALYTPVSFDPISYLPLKTKELT